MISDWSVEGTYFEACNCMVVCPCRSIGGRPGGQSTYGHCDFALSWWIRRGRADDVDLDGRQVVMAGRYRDDPDTTPEDELKVWEVALYIDDAAGDAAHDALTEIFLGRAGGTTLENFAAAIGTVHDVRRAEIDLDHRPGRQHISADDTVRVEARHAADTSEPIACGIPGLDRPGTEYHIGTFAVDTPQLQWSVTGRCGFAVDFAYRS